jgi:hypothetical protein
MMADALNIMNGAFGPLMQGDPSGLFLAKFLAATDNPVLNKMGRALEKDAGVRTQQQSELEKQKTLQEGQTKMVKAMADLEKARKAGVTLTFTGEQISQYPNLWLAYQEAISGNGAQMPQTQQQPQQQPIQNPQPQPQQQPAQPEMATV